MWGVPPILNADQIGWPEFGKQEPHFCHEEHGDNGPATCSPIKCWHCVRSWRETPEGAVQGAHNRIPCSGTRSPDRPSDSSPPGTHCRSSGIFLELAYALK